MHILSRQEMTTIDKHTIENYNIPSRLLMELAGKGCCDFIKNKLSSPAKVILFCGTGNNGGDGFVIARHLKNYHYLPLVVIVGNLSKMSPETKANYLLLEKLNIPTINIDSPQDWSHFTKINLTNEHHNHNYDIVIDALLGIGFRGTLTPVYKEIITSINKLEALKIAVDIATGLDAENGLSTAAFQADYTLTMAARKYGHYLGKGKDVSGEVVTIDIGIPYPVWSDLLPVMNISTSGSIKLPSRKSSSHKGNYGRVAIIAGSSGFTGAAILASQAALNSGAGLITLFHYSGLETVFETRLTEIMTKPLPAEITTNEASAQNLISELNEYDVLLLGPGLRISETSTFIVDLITNNWQKPAVLDADALNIIAANKEWLSRLQDKPFILTPHIGEFARLNGNTIADILSAPVKYVQDFVAEYRCTLLLKSSYRLFADQSKMVLDISGNDGLSTGGSGDVLSGIIVSLLGQGLSLYDAAVTGSYLLGTTAEKCALSYETAAITPEKIIANLFRKPQPSHLWNL